MLRTALILSLAAATSPLFAEGPVSPLVEAARRANRLGKTPVNVITNATLATAGGHVSYATTQAPITLQAPESAAAPAKRPPAAPAPAAPAHDGSSRVAHAQPRSTVATAAPTSSATSTQAGSTARTDSGQSTVTSRTGQETARSVTLPPVAPRKVD